MLKGGLKLKSNMKSSDVIIIITLNELQSSFVTSILGENKSPLEEDKCSSSAVLFMQMLLVTWKCFMI